MSGRACSGKRWFLTSYGHSIWLSPWLISWIGPLDRWKNWGTEAETWLTQSQTYSSVYAWYFLSDTKKVKGQEIKSFKTTQSTGAVASGTGTTKKITWRGFQQGYLEEKQNQILPCGSRKLVRFGGGLGKTEKYLPAMIVPCAMGVRDWVPISGGSSRAFSCSSRGHTTRGGFPPSLAVPPNSKIP